MYNQQYIMKASINIYTDDNFNDQLKKIRVYRGYKTQATLCKKINVSRQVWSLWELNKRKPTIPQLIDIANCLEIDISYFFISDANPEDYDLQIDKTDHKLIKGVSLEDENVFLLMPFINTTVSDQIFKSLEKCKEKKGIYIVNVFSDCGSSRAIREYWKLHPETVTIIEEVHFTEDDLYTIKETGILIFDDADKLPDKILSHTLFSFARNFPGSIILVGKNIRNNFIKNGNIDRLHGDFSIDCITTDDFDRIAKAALPDVSDPVMNFLRIETGVRLKKLYTIVKLIDEQKKEKTKFILTINSMIKLSTQF